MQFTFVTAKFSVFEVPLGTLSLAGSPLVETFVLLHLNGVTGGTEAESVNGDAPTTPKL